MLTEQEKNFIAYWEIMINFVSGWYKRAVMERNADFNPVVLMVALLLIIGFIAIFSKKHQWDMREQQYRELMAKQSKEEKKEN
jgi:hypothetical protein